MISILLLSICLLVSHTAQAFNVVVAGSEAVEVQLIAGKLATRAGDHCSIICVADQAERNRALLYGKGDTSEQGPFLISTGDEIGTALDQAEGMILVCGEERAIDTAQIDTLLNNAPQLKHVALLSQMGGKYRSTEDYLRKLCESVQLSVVRAGILKGGGPGQVEGEEFGLNKYFYDTSFELVQAKVTMGIDRFSLGAKVTAGDPFPAINFFTRMKNGQGIEANDADTGRIAGAAALLAAVKREKGVDVTLSTAKGERPPTDEEWESLFSSAESQVEA